MLRVVVGFVVYKIENYDKVVEYLLMVVSLLFDDYSVLCLLVVSQVNLSISVQVKLVIECFDNVKVMDVFLLFKVVLEMLKVDDEVVVSEMIE